MSTTTLCTSALFLAVILLYELRIGVHGVPLPKVSPNVTEHSTRQQQQQQQQGAVKPDSRQARLFGKWSVVAGLGLPDLNDSPPSISHREDVVIESHERPVVTSYNFPPTRWGPYFAAVYEPSLSLFLKDPLKFLASLFNPLKWFNNKGSYSVSATTPSPVTLAIVSEHSPQDNVVIVVPERENEIPDEERKLGSNKLEVKVEPEQARKGSGKKRVTKVSTAEPIQDEDALTSRRGVDRDLDLIAEETTSSPVAMEFVEDNEEEEEDLTSTTRKPTRRTKRTRRTTRHRRTYKTSTTSDAMGSNATSTSEPSTMSSPPSPYPTYYPPPTYLPPQGYHPPPYGYYPPPRQTYGPPQSTHTPPASYTRATFYPTTTSPGSSNGAGYYHGYPQNVSHVEFTTQPSPNPNPFADHRRFQHQLAFDSFDSSAFQRDASSFDYYSIAEQQPPQRRDFKEFLPDNVNSLSNDFKPSYPYQVIL